MLLVRVGNVDFHGHTDSGFLIGPGGFKGWEGSAATKRDGVDRTGAHGSFAVPAFKAARLVTLSGHALAASEAELEHMGEVLAGVGQSEQTITVQSASGARWGRGSVEGEIKFDRVGGATEAVFSLTLWMPDPFKYGETRSARSTGANVELMNRGNARAVPKFKVTGPFPGGYRLRGPAGESFSVTTALASGSVDDIDFASPVIRRNGSPLTRAVLSPEQWTIPGGGVASFRVEGISGGTGFADGFVTDTYV